MHDSEYEAFKRGFLSGEDHPDLWRESARGNMAFLWLDIVWHMGLGLLFLSWGLSLLFAKGHPLLHGKLLNAALIAGFAVLAVLLYIASYIGTYRRAEAMAGKRRYLAVRRVSVRESSRAGGKWDLVLAFGTGCADLVLPFEEWEGGCWQERRVLVPCSFLLGLFRENEAADGTP